MNTTTDSKTQDTHLLIPPLHVIIDDVALWMPLYRGCAKYHQSDDETVIYLEGPKKHVIVDQGIECVTRAIEAEVQRYAERDSQR